jgi:PHD/YefM family antitoxin component YafN of YafNO toxin-antitoxin module
MSCKFSVIAQYSMIDLRDIHPLSDFVRNTKKHVERLKESKTPEVLTINGRAEIVVQDAESYQAMLDELEKARFVESLIAAEKEFEAGKSRPASEFFSEMKTKYGV